MPLPFLDELDLPSWVLSSPPVRMSYYRLPLGDPDELAERFPSVLGLIPEQRERGTEYMVASGPGTGQGAAQSIIGEVTGPCYGKKGT
jgi:hypothetical protein